MVESNLDAFEGDQQTTTSVDSPWSLVLGPVSSVLGLWSSDLGPVPCSLRPTLYSLTWQSQNQKEILDPFANLASLQEAFER